MVQFTALPEIDEMQRLLQRLGVHDKSLPEIEAKVMAIVRESEDSSQQPPLPRSYTSSVALSQPNPSVIAERGDRQRKRPSELPVGWERREVRTATGRTYPTFHGPEGQVARSCVQAWRTARAPGMQPTLIADGSEPNSATGNPALQSVELPRAAAMPSEGPHAPASLVASSPPHARDSNVSHGTGGAQNEWCGPGSLAASGETTNQRCGPSSLAVSGETTNQPPSGDLLQVAPPDVCNNFRSVRPSQVAAARDLQAPLQSHTTQQTFYELTRGQCGTPGCGLPDYHPGICVPLRPQSRRRR